MLNVKLYTIILFRNSIFFFDIDFRRLSNLSSLCLLKIYKKEVERK